VRLFLALLALSFVNPTFAATPHLTWKSECEFSRSILLKAGDRENPTFSHLIYDHITDTTDAFKGAGYFVRVMDTRSQPWSALNDYEILFTVKKVYKAPMIDGLPEGTSHNNAMKEIAKDSSLEVWGCKTNKLQ